MAVPQTNGFSLLPGRFNPGGAFAPANGGAGFNPGGSIRAVPGFTPNGGSPISLGGQALLNPQAGGAIAPRPLAGNAGGLVNPNQYIPPSQAGPQLTRPPGAVTPTPVRAPIGQAGTPAPGAIPQFNLKALMPALQQMIQGIHPQVPGNLGQLSGL
jgi:hypothetical protein